MTLIENPEYATRNNNGSIYSAREWIRNTYVCSADNYFPENPFESEVEGSYYSVLYADGKTNEWCVTEDETGRITSVKVGGRDSWYMMGHTFWAEPFSKRFLEILEAEYNKPKTRNKLWEDIYIEHIEELSMKTRKYNQDEIYEFDSLDELREFDENYKTNSGSEILKKISNELQIKEEEIYHLVPAKDENGLVTGVKFEIQGKQFEYDYQLQKLIHGEKSMNKLDRKRIDWLITLAPFISIMLLAGVLFVFPNESNNIISKVRFFGDTVGIYYLVIGLAVLLVSVYLAFSKYGNVVLGEPNEKPKYPFFVWGSMMFTCGLAADILFYSFAEWVMYATNPHMEELGSVAEWAGVFPLFHWSFIPWAFYLVLAVVFGFMLHVRKRNRQRYSEACRPVIGKHADGVLGRVIDLFALFALLAGTATTFSVATPLWQQLL